MSKRRPSFRPYGVDVVQPDVAAVQATIPPAPPASHDMADSNEGVPSHFDVGQFDTEYLYFVPTDVAPDRKTKVIVIRSRRSGDKLGLIRWFGQWRQYALYPTADTIWNPDCLDAVNACIRALMAERKARASA